MYLNKMDMLMCIFSAFHNVLVHRINVKLCKPSPLVVGHCREWSELHNNGLRSKSNIACNLAPAAVAWSISVL